MSSKAFKWRTQSNSYVYVDSNTGSDIFGDGTQANPYQTLGKAWRGHTTYHPSMIVCRGTFCEDMSDGTHSTTIMGDYWGAATFNGMNMYTCYGFSCQNMIFEDCGVANLNGLASSTYSSPVGVGRAHAHYVGAVAYVYGVDAPSVVLKRSGLYLGCIGGSSAAKYVVYASPIFNPNYKLWFCNPSYSSNQMHCSAFNVPKASRRVNPNTNRQGEFSWWILGKCAIFLNECITFANCVFASDCEFYDGDELLELQGETSAEREAWLNDYITEKGISANLKSIFTGCVFSDKTSYDIWNDPDNADMTLKWQNCDEELVDSAGGYVGALPPALHVPIMDDSSEQPGTWDEHTASGLIGVVDNNIILRDDMECSEGEITSKLIVTNPNRLSISGVFGQMEQQYATHGIQAGRNFPEGEHYAVGETLPEGRYIARGGGVTIGENYVAENGIIVVGEEGATVTSANETEEENAYVVAIKDCNIVDSVFIRTCPTAYAVIKSTDGLQGGATYLNLFNKPIKYRGRTIVQNESFIAENDEDTFTCESDADYRIGVIFDDTRVPSQPWIPAQLFGEYFVGKSGAQYLKDSEGEFISSGNYLSFQTSANGGYSPVKSKGRAQARYIQLKLMVKSGNGE